MVIDMNTCWQSIIDLEEGKNMRLLKHIVRYSFVLLVAVWILGCEREVPTDSDAQRNSQLTPAQAKPPATELPDAASLRAVTHVQNSHTPDLMSNPNVV